MSLASLSLGSHALAHVIEDSLDRCVPSHGGVPLQDLADVLLQILRRLEILHVDVIELVDGLL
jgi:hypothetical protein